jgi:hypothetical protein
MGDKGGLVFGMSHAGETVSRSGTTAPALDAPSHARRRETGWHSNDTNRLKTLSLRILAFGVDGEEKGRDLSLTQVSESGAGFCTLIREAMRCRPGPNGRWADRLAFSAEDFAKALSLYQQAGRERLQPTPGMGSESLDPQTLAMVYFALGEDAKAQDVLKRHVRPEQMAEMSARLREAGLRARNRQ